MKKSKESVIVPRDKHETNAGLTTDTDTDTDTVNVIKEEKYVKRKTAKPAASEDATAKRGCRLPKDWTVSEELQDWTYKTHPSINIKLSFEKFCDYWDAKTGKDATKAGADGWNRTWRNWVRNEKAFYDAKNKPKASSGVAAQIGAYLQ